MNPDVLESAGPKWRYGSPAPAHTPTSSASTLPRTPGPHQSGQHSAEIKHEQEISQAKGEVF